MSGNETTGQRHDDKTRFGLPGDLPHRHHRYFIASNFMFIFALVGHSVFIPIFWILGAVHVFLYNLLCVLLDGLCLHLNHRRQYAIAFGLWTAEVTLHASMCTLAYGWDTGFHYYILSLSVFVFIAPWGKTVNVGILLGLMGIYIGLDIYCGSASATHSLSPFLAAAAKLINIAVNFCALGYMAHHYALASEKAQQALEANEKMLKTTLAASPVGIALIRNRKVSWTNDTLAEMVGFGAGKTVDPDLFLYFPDNDEVNRFEHLAYNIGESAIDLPDTRIVRRDGTQLPCHIKIRPVTPKDAAQGSIVAVMDISALKAAEKEKAKLQARIQLAKKMEAVGTLAGGVAHDLNNILSGVLSYPELLLMDISPEDPMYQPLETIRRSGEKASAIVQDLLTLARRGVPARQIVDLNAVVADYMKSPEHRKLADYHPQVTFTVRMQEDLETVCGSPVHLAKTLMNLVSNASEAIADAGTVTVSTQNRSISTAHAGYEVIEPGDYVILSVADTGQGISPDGLERIFEPFYTKKVMGRSGTGLGLAVVWGTVKDNGGYVDLSSTPGQGTRFDLYFPRAGNGAAGAESEPLGRYVGHGEHVLVVDDVPEQRTIAVGMLKKLGYQAEAVSSGEAAVAWLNAHRSDLLMLDMILDPGMDGLETYRQIIADHPHQKAIIASGFSETRKVSEALALGAASYLKKPYTVFQLAKAVSIALKDPPG